MRAGWVRSLTWLSGLLAAGALLRLAGGGDLSPPPVGSLDALGSWVDDRTPAAAAVALGRLLAELTAWYVLGVSTLHAVAGGLRSSGAIGAAEALTLPAVRHLVRSGLGMGLAATAVASPAPDTAEPGTARMAPAPVLATAGASDHTPATATMRPSEPAPPADVALAPPPPAPSTWRVEPGDSLWSIADEVLTDAWGRAPTASELDPFWRAVVDQNRPRLIDPADPDLLHPGQVLELPPAPPPV